MATVKKIIPHLWFAKGAEEAAKFYTSIFRDSRIGRTSYYTDEGSEQHHHKAGDVLTVEFELNGTQFLALNGGPEFKFNEAISLMIMCKDQEEIDHYWNKLTEGGEERECGWLKDKFGLSWQVVPDKMPDWITDNDPKKVARVMHEQFKMKKYDYATLERAFSGDLVDA